MMKHNTFFVRNCLASYRARYGITQTQLANAVGVSKNCISAIERGEWNPSLKLALSISFLFAVRVEDIFWLLGGTDHD